MKTTITSPNETAQATVRLEFLDGIRGITAIYVLLHHLAIDLQGGGLPHWLQSCLGLFRYGHFAVDIFIVLSGYSLMIPVARDGSSFLRGGIAGYIKRRAKRILPPYYAALIGAMLLLVVTQGLPRTPLGDFAGYSLPHALGIISHLLLFHNLSPEWIDEINSPLWSVATEWQIYFLFPLVLLPLYRRGGITVTVIVAFLLGMTPHWLFKGYADQACFWFLGLFALGMLAAKLNFSKAVFIQSTTRFPYGIFSLLCFAIVKILLLRHGTWLGDSSNGWWRLDPFVGLGTAGLLACWTKALLNNQMNLGIRFFSTKPLLILGAFSYSLYLTHAPIIIAIHRFLISAPISTKIGSVILLVTSVPACLILAYLFHLAFERPFMPGRPKTERQAEISAIASPAP